MRERDAIAPASPYASTKAEAESWVLEWSRRCGIPAMSLRLSNVYGRGAPYRSCYSSVISVFRGQSLAASPLTICGDGQQTRDFVEVSDVVSAFRLAAESEFAGLSLNVASGESVSINDLARLFECESVHLPARAGECRHSRIDADMIRSVLGWSPRIRLSAGVKALMAEGDVDGEKLIACCQLALSPGESSRDG